MKRILSFFLLFPLLLTFCACSHPIIYPEEETVHKWLTERTDGYSQVSPSSRMVLFSEEDGFTVKIDTGSDMNPRLTIADERTNISAVDNTILSAAVGDRLFATSTHTNRVFDPYRNGYTRAMQVYRKDASTFRIFFWLYGGIGDFYPIPRLLTQAQYEQILKIVEEYTDTEYRKSIENNEVAVNYLEDFSRLYKEKYASDLAPNPNLGVFYECDTPNSDYLSVYTKLFNQMGLSPQEWRESFADLGYVGEKSTLKILYCDLTVGEGTVDIVLKTKDSYTSPLASALSAPWVYTFCPSISLQEFVHITQE